VNKPLEKSNRICWSDAGLSQNLEKMSEIWQRGEKFRLKVSLSCVGAVCAK
jgi:hypothetical protein